MTIDVNSIKDQVAAQSDTLHQLRSELGRVLVGQEYLVSRLMIALISDGHVLLEGVPGLAKTLAIKSLASTIDTHFQRIQFTPDLLPADLLGTLIYNPRDGSFETRKGPIFANFILADEINRAPAKVQSALLEAMQERQVSLGETTYPLEPPFLVMATQNPIEQEGTYPLPEAQVDRFMLKVLVSYPKPEEERKVMDMALADGFGSLRPVTTPQQIMQMREIAKMIYMDDQVRDYVVSLIQATRRPEQFQLQELKPLLEFGASPRATISLALAARANAFLLGRGFVTPQDVKDLAADVLRHRIVLSYEAEAEQKTADDVIQSILETVPVP